MDLASLGHALSVWLLPLLLAITLHEAAHGWAADRLGDDTARRLGRVSLNPVRHVDPVGTLVLPAVLLAFSPIVFGWAKPVPVVAANLRRPVRDMALVAAAGPAMNAAIALICAWLLLVPSLVGGALSNWLALNLLNAMLVNVILAAFNLVPIPPLDGGRIAVSLLPRPLARRWAGLERWGLLIVLALVFVVPMASDAMGLGINPLVMFLTTVLRPAIGLLAWLSPWTFEQLWGAFF